MPTPRSCKDIPDDVFLTAVDEVIGAVGVATRWDLARVLAYGYECDELPERLLLAKARRLIRRGLLSGCWCGCRGDFTRLQPVVSEIS